MENYTKQQLIEAMTKYNEKFKNEPELFNPNIDWTSKQKAENQINYLIDIIETGEAK